ncbi:transposase [Bradyrhizobium diazoefficiens]
MMASRPLPRFIATVGAPFADESLRGYLGRTLSVTAVRNLATLLKLADATKPNAVSLATTLTDKGEIERIAALIGCAPDDILARTYPPGELAHSGSESIQFFGTEVRLHFRETKYRRVSPRALDLAQYHRAIWELRPIAFDPQTREKLLGICPVCERKLGWLRADVPTLCDKCDDVDLRDFPQPVSPVEDEEAYQFVVGLVDPDPVKKEAARRLLPEDWSGFSNGDLFETAVALASGLTLDPAQQAKNAQGRSKRSDQFEALTPELLALAGRAIIGGVDGFAALTQRYRDDMQKRPLHYGRRKELGPLAYVTYDRHIEPRIRTLLGALIEKDMQTTCRDYALRKGPDADGAMLAIDALAKTFGVRRSVLQRLARSGLIPVARAVDAVRSPVRMAVRDVGPLIEQMKDAIGENEAAGMLGLPLPVLPRLADRGLIERLEGPVRGLVPGCCGYTKSSVEALMTRIWSAIRPGQAKCRSIAVAVRSIGPGETPWAAVISAIVAGDVVVHDTGAQRRNIRFSLAVDDTAAFVAGVNKHLHGTATPPLPQWIAQSTAAEILQVNAAFLSRLANMRPDLLPQQRPGYTPYLTRDVEALAARYVFVPEIGRRVDMHSRRVVSWLRTQKVVPLFSLQENRDFAFDRDTVEPLLTQAIGEAAATKNLLTDAPETIRTKFIAAIAAGGKPKATAAAMGLPYRKAKRWVEVWRETGAVTERKFGFRSKLDEHEDFLRTLLAQRPSLQLSEVTEALAARGVTTSDTAVWNAIERFGITLAGRRRPANGDQQTLSNQQREPR